MSDTSASARDGVSVPNQHLLQYPRHKDLTVTYMLCNAADVKGSNTFTGLKSVFAEEPEPAESVEKTK